MWRRIGSPLVDMDSMHDGKTPPRAEASSRSPSPRTVTFDLSDTIDGEDVPFALSCIESISTRGEPIRRQMFKNATSFNQPLNNWDVSNVTDMRRMFNGARSFNQPLNNWNVSNVTDMELMFYAAHSFNQPLNDWNVSNVTDMNFMFENARSLVW